MCLVRVKIDVGTKARQADHVRCSLALMVYISVKRILLAASRDILSIIPVGRAIRSPSIPQMSGSLLSFHGTSE